jgi:predicted nuclease of predicted toxin-antitoxin system
MKYSPQKIVFFIDRCLGNKIIAETLKKTGITIEIHDDNFPQNALDVDWLPEVGKREWIILTKDAKIGKNRLERLAVTQAKIRMFALASQNLSGEDMLIIFQKAVTQMLKFIDKNPAPFIARVHRDGTVKAWKNSQELLAEVADLLENQ